MTYDTDVIIVGSGGGGAVAAKELGEMGLSTVVLEAGPWYGNKRWPNPNREQGDHSSSSLEDLDKDLLKKHLNKNECNMNDFVSGRYRWGPADRSRAPWLRKMQPNGFVWSVSGVGGTTQKYLANCPRAYPGAIDDVWPISYRELIPYYEKVEDTLPVRPAPSTAKEELFYYGAGKAGYSLLNTLNVTGPGYRPQPNAILHPNERLNNPDYPMERLASDFEGCTLCGHCVNGCPHGPSVEKMAKRPTSVSYVPLALKTGKVEIRPNTFSTKVLTERDPGEGIRAVGVQFRDTWTGEMGQLTARAVVMAAGSIESPRLWMNSGLPLNPWVGKGLTTHWFDYVYGVFDEKDLSNILGTSSVNPHVGQNSAARFEYPGLGMIQPFGMSPGLFAINTSFSHAGYSFLRESDQEEPWNSRGRVVGSELKEIMANYRNTLGLLIIADDEPNQRNGVTLDPVLKDEHGPVPVVQYYPSEKDRQKRDKLAKIAGEILRNAGARKVMRTDLSPGLMVHMQSTMRMGHVVDSDCEAYQVKRLFIADNSALFNGIGGPNPTLTTQALATRTAEKLANKYFATGFVQKVKNYLH